MGPYFVLNIPNFLATRQSRRDEERHSSRGHKSLIEAFPVSLRRLARRRVVVVFQLESR